MIKETQLKQEKEYLKKVISAVKTNSALNVIRKEKAKKEFDELISYVASEFNHIDDEEKSSINQSLNDIGYNIDMIDAMQKRLEKQLISPYFAKINFKADDEKISDNYYIGINNLFCQENQIPLVIDWRAPIASMYYDYDVGRASFVAPDGIIKGNLSEKRQFKIVQGKIKYSFDTSTTIRDDILIETLGENSSPVMKNIVATIQQEQNKIIRSGTQKNMLVQGIAGSGKTSVALHRVAYLLYNNREKLKAENILIISPTKIFSSYISNILPELGEENIEEITFDEIAKLELKPYLGELETRESMQNDIISGNEERRKIICLKSSFDFYEKLKQFINSYFNMEFEAKDIIFGEQKIAKEVIDKLYHETYKQKIPAVRIEWITDYILDRLNITSNVNEIAKRVKLILYPMFSSIDMVDIYSQFLTTLGLNYLPKNNLVPNEDIAPFMFIKNYCLGIAKNPQIKYLVIDEMQDYSPLHFDVITDMFDCQKIILGDIFQTFDKDLDEVYLNQLSRLVDAELIQLDTCYRSTKEITKFAEKQIDKKLNCVARTNVEPQIMQLKDEEKIAYIEAKLFDWKNYNQVAIITKDILSAEKLSKELQDSEKYNLINGKNSSIKKINLIPINYSKGLEFDAVIIYDFNDKKITEKYLKKLLYIASTRALHDLCIIN